MVNKLRVQYCCRFWGDDGPAIVVTHATLMDLVSLEPLTDKLTAAGFRAVALDLRGYGEIIYDQKS